VYPLVKTAGHYLTAPVGRRSTMAPCSPRWQGSVQDSFTAVRGMQIHVRLVGDPYGPRRRPQHLRRQ